MRRDVRCCNPFVKVPDAPCGEQGKQSPSRDKSCPCEHGKHLKSLPPTEKGEARSDGTSRVVEAIQRDARLRVAVQRHVYALQCKLLETVDADYLDWTVRVGLCSKLLL